MTYADLYPAHVRRPLPNLDVRTAYRDLFTPAPEPNPAGLASLIRWGVPIAEAANLATSGDGPACAAAIRKHAGRI